MQPLHDLLHLIVHHIPLHRVRTVYKDGVVMWQRPGHPDGD